MATIKRFCIPTTMLLILSWTASCAQGLTRSDKEILVKELIKGDECQRTAQTNDSIMADMRRQVADQKSVVVVLNDQVDQFKTQIIPSWQQKEIAWVKEQARLEAKIKKKNFWSAVKDVGLIVLVAEVVHLAAEK